jgi:DNA-directed RNA polymerase subunit N (RpoN/RPB10)
MLIHIKCVTCGKVIGGLYEAYKAKVHRYKMEAMVHHPHEDPSRIQYLDETNMKDKSPEGRVLDELGFTSMCCRRHLMTHVDIHY